MFICSECAPSTPQKKRKVHWKVSNFETIKGSLKRTPTRRRISSKAGREEVEIEEKGQEVWGKKRRVLAKCTISTISTFSGRFFAHFAHFVAHFGRPQMGKNSCNLASTKQLSGLACLFVDRSSRDCQRRLCSAVRKTTHCGTQSLVWSSHSIPAATSSTAPFWLPFGTLLAPFRRAFWSTFEPERDSKGGPKVAYLCSIV